MELLRTYKTLHSALGSFPFRLLLSIFIFFSARSAILRKQFNLVTTSCLCSRIDGDSKELNLLYCPGAVTRFNLVPLWQSGTNFVSVFVFIATLLLIVFVASHVASRSALPALRLSPDSYQVWLNPPVARHLFSIDARFYTVFRSRKL